MVTKTPKGNGEISSLQEQVEKPPPGIEPIAESARVMQVIQAMLKTPLTLVARFKQGESQRLQIALLATWLICMIAYGLIVGSFSGGIQWYAAPIKITVGLFLTALFCFPSLYIFSCLSGAEIKLNEAAGLLLNAVTLAAVLLIGFAPVAWVFSQSTNSVFFMGFFHLLFWSVSILFGLRLILKGLKMFKAKGLGFICGWVVIFLITSLQMMTALRPLIGTADTLLPEKKQFFLQHWCITLIDEIEEANEESGNAERLGENEKPEKKDKKEETGSYIRRANR